MFYRWQILEKVAKGEMPPGMTEEDLRAMDMPLPGEVELVEEPGGRVLLRRVKNSKPAAKPAAFACDTPDDE